MRNKTILEKDGTLESVLDCCKNHHMCDKALGNYPHALQFVHGYYTTVKLIPHISTTTLVPECCKTQKTCGKAVNRCFLYLFFILYQNKTQHMCGRIVSEVSFMIIYSRDKYKNKGMCGEAVDNCLTASKFIPD